MLFCKRNFFLILLPFYLFSLPQVEKVVHGCVSFEKKEGQINITQSCPKAIIDWKDFSLSQNEKITFVQNENFSVLNRVTTDKISQIYGSVEAKGKFYLINQNGIFIGPSGVISAKEVILSTLELSKEDFLKSNNLYFFSKKDSKIQNFGEIKAIGDNIFIISKNIENAKNISAKKGEVNLISANEILLVDENKNIIIKPHLDDFDGSITNSGKIEAIETKFLSSNNNLDCFAINQKGLVEARGFYKKDGKVILSAMQGKVANEGKIIASNEDDTGGKVHLFAKKIHFTKEALIDVSGKLAGGEILIGRDFINKNPNILNAKEVFIGRNTKFYADALLNGDGGKIFIWSDNSPVILGDIFARGGKYLGNGGFVEVSSLRAPKWIGLTDLSAADGKMGTAFIDPYNLTITTSATSPDRWTGPDPYRYDAGANTDNISSADISSKLSMANVIITTGETGSIDDGTITIQSGANINWSTSGSLTIQASKNFILQSGASINSSAGSGAITITNSAASTALDYIGIDIQGTVLSGSGKITINGTGSQITEGSDSGNHGVYIAGDVTSSTGDIEVIGTKGQKPSSKGINSSATVSSLGNIIFSTDNRVTVEGEIACPDFTCKPKCANCDMCIACDMNMGCCLEVGDLLNFNCDCITLGDTTTATMNIGAFTHSKNFKFYADTINVTGAMNCSGKDVGFYVGQGSNSGALNLLKAVTAAHVNIAGGGNENNFVFHEIIPLDTIDGGVNKGTLEIKKGNHSWTINGSGSTPSSGSVSGDMNFSFDRIKKIKGSNETNEININTSGSLETIESGNGDNTYNINGGDVTDSVIMGSGDDIFVFSDGQTVTVENGVTFATPGSGKIHRLDYSNYTSSIYINLSSETFLYGITGTMLAYSTTGFNNGAANKLINISPTTINDIVANDSFDNELVGFNSLWEITGIYSGTVDGVPYAGIQIINGTGNDIFNFSLTGTEKTVKGKKLTDYFNFGYTYSPTPHAVPWTGDVTSQLTGGQDKDIFIFWGDYNITATIKGQSGSENEIRGPPSSGSNTSTLWQVTGGDEGYIQPSGAAAATEFKQISFLIGSNRADTFEIYPGGSMSGNIDGGGGVNTIQSFSGVSNTWNITDNNAGNITPQGGNKTDFNNIQNLIGSIGSSDIFVISDGKGLSGSIDGGACFEGNLLDYSSYTTPINVSPDCPGGSGVATNILGGISHIDGYIDGIKPNIPMCQAYTSEDLIATELRRFVEFNRFLQRYRLLNIKLIEYDKKQKLFPEFLDYLFRGLKKRDLHSQRL